MYDWANSVYPLVITSAIFPIYYDAVTTDADGSSMVTFLGFQLENTVLYNYALAFAYLVIASLSPLLSGIADYGGKKKSFMQFFCYLGAISCSLLYFFTSDTLWLGVLLIVTAALGWAGSIVFYNAYLPEIAEPKDQDRVSAQGFAYGYVGSVILLIFNLVMVMVPDLFFDVQAKVSEIAAENPGLTLEEATEKADGYFSGLSSRISFLTVGLWWILFAQIPFKILPSNVYKRKPGKHIFRKGYEELMGVWRDLKKSKRLKRFLSAFFIYNMGVQTVMLVATLFGAKELGLETGELVITVLIIQLIAILGAFAFSFLSKIKSNLFTLKIATFIWVGICIGAYFVPAKAPIPFYILAFCVGFVMGGIQSLSRSTFSKFLPETEDHASYFSLLDVCDKIGLVLGLAIYGLIEQSSGSLRNAVIALLVFFVVGFILLQRVPEEEEAH